MLRCYTRDLLKLKKPFDLEKTLPSESVYPLDLHSCTLCILDRVHPDKDKLPVL